MQPPVVLTDSDKPTKVRWFIISLACLLTLINYLDRVNLAIAAPIMSKELGLNPAMLGVVFSTWGFAYTIAGVPVGCIMDRFGTRLVYTVGLFGWSMFTVLTGAIHGLNTLLGCRIGVGIFESTQKPANLRIATAWFPRKERGKAVGSYITFEYVGQAFCLPLLAWILITYGWASVFYITGALGIAATFIWWQYYRDPGQSKSINQAELDYINQDREVEVNSAQETRKITRSAVRNLFTHRLLWGMYVGQFALASTFYFFATWLPSYLVAEKGMTLLKVGFFSSLPYVGALVGAQFGTRWTDWMFSKGYSVSSARKIPIITGLVASSVVIGCNFTDNPYWVMVCLVVALSGQAMGVAMGWTLMSDVAPRGYVGFYSGVFNCAAMLGGSLTPMVIGFIVNATHSFVAALSYVAGVSLLGAFCYIFVIGKVYRIEIAD